MTHKTYHTFIATIMLLVPYGWGLPKNLVFVSICSAAVFAVVRYWLLRKFDRARLRTSRWRAEPVAYLSAATALLIGHAAFIQAMSE
ncbi:hypothetical protein DB354_05300 [Opitutus sp. ER46]|nr:hypothetical protein DB354_05300 [Opitutus sp. ER46]